jgi:hypothetical protein
LDFNFSLIVLIGHALLQYESVGDLNVTLSLPYLASTDKSSVPRVSFFFCNIDKRISDDI